MNTPSRTLQVNLISNKYELSYPNTGGLIDIEIMKASLSGNRYEAIASSASNAASYARFVIDAVATFSIMCPQMRKDLKVDAFTDLDPMQFKTVLDAYIKEVLPWLNEWERALAGVEEEEKKEDKKE